MQNIISKKTIKEIKSFFCFEALQMPVVCRLSFLLVLGEPHNIIIFKLIKLNKGIKLNKKQGPSLASFQEYFYIIYNSTL